jgi:hypothetical protein
MRCTKYKFGVKEHGPNYASAAGVKEISSKSKLSALLYYPALTQPVEGKNGPKNDVS